MFLSIFQLLPGYCPDEPVRARNRSPILRLVLLPGSNMTWRRKDRVTAGRLRRYARVERPGSYPSTRDHIL